MCSPVVPVVVTTEVLANFINVDKRIKGIQRGDHEIKIVNFADNTTILLKYITCRNRIQVILRLYKKDKLVQREFFQKAKPLWGGTYKNRIHQQDNWNSHNFH